MSSPTYGSDPNQPPQGQPGWGAPPPAPGHDAPAPSWSGAPGGYGAAQRPGQVTAAAIIGIVIGGIGTLFGLLGLSLVFAFSAILGLLGLLSLAAAVVVLIGGIQVLTGKSPKLLLLGSYASLGVTVLFMLWSVVSGFGFAFSNLLSLVLPALIVFFLLQPQAKQYFASRGMNY